MVRVSTSGYNALMNTVSLRDLQRDTLAILCRAQAGESLLVVHGGQPIAELRPPPVGRPYGLAAGEFTVPDDFDAALPDDILQGFEGDEDFTKNTYLSMVHYC